MKIGIIGLGTLGEYYTRDFNRFNTKVIVSKNSTLKYWFSDEYNNDNNSNSLIIIFPFICD